MSLSAEQIQANWEKFIGYINTYISDPRREKVLAFYKKFEDDLVLMPASHKVAYHNAFPGGYIDHVNRVIEGALAIPRTSMVFIIHQADLMAARIEFEQVWLSKFNEEVLDKPKAKKLDVKTKALGSMKSEGLKNMLNSL
jgi:hypothetical protein